MTIAGELHSQIGVGLMVLVGVEQGDTLADMEWLAAKTASMRIFPDANGVMNVAIADVPEARVMAVSQFTLTASTRKGNRPSYIRAAGHDVAVPLYEAFCQKMEDLLGRPVARGVFGADMQVTLVNDGPVTIVIDSRLRE